MLTKAEITSQSKVAARESLRTMQFSLRNAIGLTLAISLVTAPSGVAQSRNAASISRFPKGDWQAFASPQEAGFSAPGLTGLDDECKRSGAACVMVICDGAVLFQFGDSQARFMCHSVRKSFMSALYGIYVHNGDIDLNRTLQELGIDDVAPELTATEKQAKVVDLLTSRSGVYHPSAYEPEHMTMSRPQRGAYRPGTHWFYNNWDFNALLTVFEQESGEKFFEAFNEHIAKPVGMQDFRLRDGYYHREPESSIHAAYPFQMSARDMARLGLLMASDGRWGDRQIVPADWVDASTRVHSEITRWHGFDGYGYLWLVGRFGGEKLFSAQGNGGNSIDVFPGRKLVFVFRADTYHGKSIDGSIRWRIVRKVMEAQAGTPVPTPNLIPLADSESLPKPVTLSHEYLGQFPLDLPRELPRDLPPKFRDEPVRIERIGGTLVLYTARPPAMSLDLIPLAKDRFWIMEFNEIGIIDRDEKGVPTRFLLKGDLLRHVRELEAAGKSDEADRERQLAEKLFRPPKTGK